MHSAAFFRTYYYKKYAYYKCATNPIEICSAHRTEACRVVTLSTLSKKTGTLILALEPPDGGSRDYDKIREAISSLDGILITDVNYVTHVIKIEFDGEKLTINKIQDKLKKIQEKAKATDAQENI